MRPPSTIAETSEITDADVKQIFEVHVHPGSDTTLSGAEITYLKVVLNKARENALYHAAERKAASSLYHLKEDISAAASSARYLREWFERRRDAADARGEFQNGVLHRIQNDLEYLFKLTGEIRPFAPSRHDKAWPHVVVGIYIPFSLIFKLTDFIGTSRTTSFARFASAAIPLVTGEPPPGPPAVAEMMARIDIDGSRQELRRTKQLGNLMALAETAIEAAGGIQLAWSAGPEMQSLVILYRGVSSRRADGEESASTGDWIALLTAALERARLA